MIQIKEGLIDNLEELVALDQGVFSGMYDHEPFTLETYREKLEGKDPIILVARDEDKVVGDAIAFERDKTLYIWIMAVLKDYRGQGIAKRFFEILETKARQMHLCALTVKTYGVNEEMLGLLKKKGFEITEHISSPQNSQQDAFRLKLVLKPN